MLSFGRVQYHFLWPLELFIFFIPFVDKMPLSKQNIAPDGMPDSAALHLGLYGLLMCH